MTKFIAKYRYDKQKLEILCKNENSKKIIDTIDYEDEQYCIYMTGCILNDFELRKEYSCNNNVLLLQLLYEKYSLDMIKKIKGSFVIVIYEKNTQRFFIANDLLSKSSLYYYNDDTLFAISHNVKDLLFILHEEERTLIVDKLAIAMMLKDGFLWDNVTYVQQIKYLKPFEYIFVDKDEFCVQRYLQEKMRSISNYETTIREFDKLFRQAVKRQFNKNETYNCRQLATLSAGMDSRATVLTGYELGYKDITCITYAQSNSLDDTIARKIAFDYKFHHLFYQLDAASFLLAIDEQFDCNEGEQTYAGATGAFCTMELLDADLFGVIHTGLLGGELMGDLQTNTSANPPINPFIGIPGIEKDIAESFEPFISKYTSQEHMDIEKNLRGCQNFSRMMKYKFEAFSPFMDEDVYQFLIQVPESYKYGRRFYVDWMKEYIPNQYYTTHFLGSITKNAVIRKARYVRTIIERVIRGKNRFEMNPFTYWWLNNRDLQNDIIKYYRKEIEKCQVMEPKLKRYFEELDLSNPYIVIQGITALKGINMIMKERNLNTKK